MNIYPREYLEIPQEEPPAFPILLGHIFYLRESSQIEEKGGHQNGNNILKLFITSSTS